MVQAGLDDPRVLDVRRKILRAASAIFRAKGFHETGMRDIAAAMGIAVGKLYYYFESKPALLAFCQEDSLWRLLAVHAAVGGLDLPAEQRLYPQIAGHVRCLHEGGSGSLAHLEVDGLAEPDRRRILALRDRYEETVRQLIAQGIADGRFRAVDAKLAALAVLGALNWTARWYRSEGGLDPAALGRTFAELLATGLLAPGVTLVAPSLDLLPEPAETEESHA